MEQPKIPITFELPSDLNSLNKIRELLPVQEALILEKAFTSNDPIKIIEATKHYNEIAKREKTDIKAFLTDPLDSSSAFGFKPKDAAISFQTLRRMSHVPIVRSIISTRIEQIATFSQPQPDKHSPGFVIRRKQKSIGDASIKPSRQDAAKISFLTDFILNCGSVSNAWHGDDFDAFLRKFTDDSLALDQACFEVISNKKGVPVEFVMVDGATVRLADSYNQDAAKEYNSRQIQGYLPSYVQVYNEQIMAEFYPWEMCFGIRNPSTNIYTSGYGQSELEDLIQIVTAVLWADQYNMNFFKIGSAPKGILKVMGNVNPNSIAEFRQKWTQMVSGAQNAHRVPIIESDKMEWVDLQMNNRDMEFAQFHEYLRTSICALYKISPEELGYKSMNGGSGGNGTTFESGQEAKLEYSKDKGLRPQLKFTESKINKYLISRLDPEFEFKFVGLDEDTAAAELDANIKKMSNFMTVNEIREIMGLKKVENADYISNSMYFQNKGQIQQQEQMDQQQAMQDQQSQGDPNENPFLSQ